MVAYTFRMPAGIPGEVTRFQTLGTTIEPEQINTTAANTGAALATPTWTYGAMVIVDASGARPIVAGDSTPNAQQIGVLVRPFPGPDKGVAFPGGTVGFGAGAPPTQGTCDVLRRGYCNVKVNGATAASRVSGVFLYYGTSTGSHVQGGLEAASGANLVQLTQANFMGPADANGNCEMAWNL